MAALNRLRGLLSGFHLSLICAQEHEGLCKLVPDTFIVTCHLAITIPGSPETLALTLAILLESLCGALRLLTQDNHLTDHVRHLLLVSGTELPKCSLLHLRWPRVTSSSHVPGV